MRIPLAAAVSATGARVSGPAPAGLVFDRVGTDTRHLVPGSLFVALAGPRHDGHDHVAEAWAAGAAGVVAHRPVPAGPGPVLRVEDTLTALGALGRWVREAVDLRVVAVTGSAGKTTTKELIATLLRAVGLRILQTPGNWNNRVGLPLTLLGAAGDEQVAVLELGVSERGEMACLADVARPDVAVITGVGVCHTEGLGGIEGVAEEKLRIVEGLRPGGTLVVPAGQPLLRPPATARCVTFGWDEGADLRGEAYESRGADGSAFQVAGCRVRLPLPGRHNASNALSALAAVQALGVAWAPAVEALGRVALPALRGEVRRSAAGVWFVVDCYNANPQAVEAALETLADLAGPARRVAVLGEMRELGALCDEGHAQVGRAAARLGVDELHLLGRATAPARDAATAGGLPPDRVWLYEDRDTLAAALALRLRPGDWVLVKGSRALGLETVVERLGA